MGNCKWKRSEYNEFIIISKVSTWESEDYGNYKWERSKYKEYNIHLKYLFWESAEYGKVQVGKIGNSQVRLSNSTFATYD